MKPFNKTWNVGDHVRILNMEGIYKITKIHETRCWIELTGFDCSFPRDVVSKRFDLNLLVKH